MSKPDPRFPPTPAMSGEFIITDNPAAGDSFILPPAALPARSPNRDPSLYSPASPGTSTTTTPTTRHNPVRTRTKRCLDDLELPPPPTRTRKIIQMKPQPKDKERAKDNEKEKNGITSSSNTGKKKPGPSRKTARKTAHSLIERRRRSKMNEEFSTLKDMIPACRGQDMHKLAILQASIDYVNYLEQCLQDVKRGPAGSNSLPLPPAGPPSPTSPHVWPVPGTGTGRSTSSGDRERYPESVSISPDLVPGTHGQLSPPTRVPSSSYGHASTSTLPSPILGPGQAGHQQVYSWGGGFSSANMSPSTLSLNLNQNRNQSRGLDHEASAALLMLNQDRRGTADSITERFVLGTGLGVGSGSGPVGAREGEGEDGGQRKTGMSVRDLLS